MQLSVFLTPIIAKQIDVGFGVCEELAVFSQFKTTPTHSSLRYSSISPHSALRNHDMSNMSMADMPHMVAMQSVHSKHSSHHESNRELQSMSHTPIISTIASTVSANDLKPHAEPSHQHHKQCEFCLLLGHSVLPPLHVVIAVLLTPLIAKMMVKAKTTDALFLNQNKNLRPQGRAPPQFIS